MWQGSAVSGRIWRATTPAKLSHAYVNVCHQASMKTSLQAAWAGPSYSNPFYAHLQLPQQLRRYLAPLLQLLPAEP
jgi:hypothetical protein